MHNIGISDTTVGMFISDMVFFLIIGAVYFGNIKSDLKRLKEDCSWKKLIKTVVIWVVGIFALNIVMGIITEIFVPGLETDENTTALMELATVSFIYTIFKTMIFGVVAEELLFRESLSECIENDKLFILITAVIYTLMNFIFTNNVGDHVVIYVLLYFLPALFFSYLYVKHDRNIIILMLVKFVYNLIPLMLLILFP